MSTVPLETWNLIKIQEDGTHYIVSINDMTFETRDNSRKISKVWIGNPQNTFTNVNWASILMDFFKIYKTQPIGRVPVVVIPGFGGSWDIGAILSGTAGNHWAVPPFVKNYDGVLQSFRNAGYVDDTDLFVFPYDWRKPLTDLADDLKSFIDSKNLTEKIDLIGHSMGGLVARSYGQKYGVDKIDKILTVGSPHLGVIDMYGLWEGAKVWDGAWWQNVLLETATEVNRLPGETKVSAIRRVAPSIIDLFPTFPFLLANNLPISVDSMFQKNQYLKTLNQDVTVLAGKLNPFWSEDIPTTRIGIDIEPRSPGNVLEGKWEDGRPVAGDPFRKTNGDGSVTKESAIGPFGPGEKMTGWHGDLLADQNNVGLIFQKLGLDPTLAVSSITDSRRRSFVAILRSPGSLEVCDKQLINCNDQLGLYYPEDKLFILPGYQDQDLIVKVKEKGLGKYKLHLGNLSDSPDWTVAEGELKDDGQVDFYKYQRDGENGLVALDKTPPQITITTPADNEDYLLRELVQASWLAEDEQSGVATTSATVDSGVLIDTSAVGPHTFTVSATDLAGNTDTKSISYSVIYQFGDLQAPKTIDSKTFKNTSTIPIKFKLFDAQGSYVTNAVATLKVDGLAAVSNGKSNIGNYFKYDSLTNQYIFNLSTKMKVLAKGTHELVISLDDGKSYTAWITIR